MDSILSDTSPARTANVLHLAPPEPARLARLALPALAAAADSGGVLRTLILVEDAEAAVAVANHAALEIGGGLTPIVALTSSARARRVLAAAMPAAAAMPVAVAAALMARSALPSDGIRQLILALPDSLDAPESAAALEAVMATIPKGATRTLVAAQESPAVESIVERYFFKARRTREETVTPTRAEDRPLHVLATAPGARWDALRRLLDEIDPPSAAVLTPDAGTHADAVRALAALGYPSDGLVEAIRESPPAGIALVVIVGVPDPKVLRAAFDANPVHVIVLCGPREVRNVRTIVGGHPVAPWALEGPRARAESRVAATRARLREILASGSYASEMAAVGPLLEEYDGSEIAAAALAMAAEWGRTAPPVQAAPAPAPQIRPREQASGPRRPDAGGERPLSKRPADRAYGARSRDDRPRDDRPRGDRQRDDRPRGSDRPRDDRPRDDRPRDDRPRKFDDRPRGGRPGSDRPRSSGPRDDRPRSSGPRDDRPRSGPPRSGPPRGERPRDDRPRKFDDRRGRK